MIRNRNPRQGTHNNRRLKAPLAGTALSAVLSFVLAFLAPAGTAQEDEPSFELETKWIAEVLGLRPGMSVADVGAGEGEYSAFLADQVGPAGEVYATEVVEDLVAGLRDTVGTRRNVTVILGEHDDTGLPEQCCDRILLRRVYHHFRQPEPMLESLLASLKPNGVIAIIDFLRPRNVMRRSDATPQDREHGIRIPELIDTAESSGFELLRQVEDWPSRVVDGKETDFCLLFRRTE